VAGEVRDDPSVLGRLNEVLGPIAVDYDLLLIDSAPGDFSLHEVLAATTHYYLVPTQGDRSSNDGIADVLMRIKASREGTVPLNPALELLGIVVTFVPTGGKAIDRQIRGDIRELLGDDVTIFSPSIRWAKQAAMGVREKGLGVAEYEAAKAVAEKHMPWYKAKSLGVKPERFSSAAAGLADDYQRLVEEVLAAFTERQKELGYL
jgi:cellulose biosynthesis protein BcsQ